MTVKRERERETLSYERASWCRARANYDSTDSSANNDGVTYREVDINGVIIVVCACRTRSRVVDRDQADLFTHMSHERGSFSGEYFAFALGQQPCFASSLDPGVGDPPDIKHS